MSRAKGLAFLTTVCLLATTAAQAAKIAEVRVEGNDRLSDSAVLSYITSRVGQEYSEHKIREDQQRLLNSHRFESVETDVTKTDAGVVVTFKVVERPVVSGVTIEGNKSIKTDELMRALPFGPHDPLNLFNVEAGRKALEAAYRDKGYFFASITYNEKLITEKRAVVYRVVEGPKVAVKKVRFEGNHYYSSLWLLMKISTSPRFWPFSQGLLDTDQIDRDVSTIRGLYFSEGFLDVEVGRDLQFSADKKSVIVTFIIREGQRYRINKVLFRGNTVFSNAELSRRLMLQQGKFYTAEKQQLDLKKLENTYGELGYINATVTMKMQYLNPTAKPPAWAAHLGKSPALLNVIFDIREHDQYHIGEISILGNTTTQTRVIRRALRFYPEQLYNTVAVNESRHRLLETRLFKSVEITPTGDQPGVRNIVVHVEEAKTAQFQIGAGLNSNDGPFGMVQVTQQNFDLFRWPATWDDIARGRAWKGGGQKLSLTAAPGFEVMRFHIDWTEPALFDRNIALQARGFYFTRERDKYDESRAGALGSVGHRFKNRWYGEISPRIENVDVSRVDSDAASEIKDAEGNNLLVGIKGTLVRDRTDSRWAPSTGDRFLLSYEQVTADWNFGRLDADYKIYRTLYVDALDRKHVLSARVGAGQIFGDAPVFEKYYAGGIGSIRGFKYRGISPRGAGINDQIGGDFRMLASVQYEFPLVGDQLRGVVFVDTGTVESDFGINSYRASAGVGIQWLLPMFGSVPMNLDIAFPFAKNGQDDTQILSFSLGLTF